MKKALQGNLKLIGKSRMSEEIAMCLEQEEINDKAIVYKPLGTIHVIWHKASKTISDSDRLAAAYKYFELSSKDAESLSDDLLVTLYETKVKERPFAYDEHRKNLVEIAKRRKSYELYDYLDMKEEMSKVQKPLNSGKREGL